MERRWLKVLTVVAIAAGAAAACDRPAPITSPGAQVSPRVAVTAGSYTLGGFTLLSGSGGSDQTKSLIITENGGKINFGPNSLDVPYRAVSGPTKFTFTLQSKPYIVAKLTAVAITYDSKGKAIEGAAVTTFAKPLTLTLSYSQSSTPIPDPSKLKMLWVENGTIMAAYKPSVDVKGQKLIQDVTHFTDYQPAVPGPCDATSLDSCQQL